jgi:oxygen-independent coproporphyrinogen-3 oxidase
MQKINKKENTIMREIALYIHIPFCKQKCLYCDFTSFAKLDGYMEDYIEALNKEIIDRCKGYKIKSLFIGGGTPTYLDDVSLQKLMNTIKKLDFTGDVEKSMECNPGTVDKNKLEIIRDGGINRLSFGLQTTKNSLLKKIGRIHSYEEFKKNYKLAREIGFNNINIDIMFGLPDQSLEDYEESLNEIADLSPEHISAYSLIIEEGTPFYKLFQDNKLNLPNEDTERDMYSNTKKILQSKGYIQYEISNYAKDGMECFHNNVYWKTEEYIGVGLGASSFIDNKRIKNIEDLDEYIDKLKNSKCIFEEVYVNTNKDNIEEFMFMGLRMIEGIEEKEFQKRFGVSLDSVYEEVLNNNINKGLLERTKGRIYLTEKGIELSNYVMSDMIL